MDGWLHTWFMIVHHINLAWCRLRGKLMEEVEERNEDGSCHEDQEFLFVIIVHVDFLFTVNHANDVEWIWWLQILCRRVIRLQWSSVGQDMRMLTSQPGNWNGWIFCTHGDGATVVLYTFIHTSIYHHVSVLCPIMTCCHCSLALEDNCHVLL